MGHLVKVFKPDPFVLWLIKGMMVFGLLVALAGFAAHHAAISCLGIFILTIFSLLGVRQPTQAIQIFDDCVVFFYPGQEVWTINFESFTRLELTTAYKNISKYSPGRTIMLRFVEWDDELCAEVNVSVFDKNAIRTMVELILARKPDLKLNDRAAELLQIADSKSTTISAVTKTE
jgi:hypothetical protein